jgi:hypothetical protein
VVVRLRLEGVEEAQLVDVPGDVGKQVTDPRARLAVLLPPEGAGEEFVLAPVKHVGVPGRLDGPADRRGDGLAVEPLQRGLVVERVHLTRAAHLEEEDHRPGFGPEVGRSRGERPERIDPHSGVVPPGRRAGQECRQGQGAEPPAGAMDEVAAGGV